MCVCACVVRSESVSRRLCADYAVIPRLSELVKMATRGVADFDIEPVQSGMRSSSFVCNVILACARSDCRGVTGRNKTDHVSQALESSDPKEAIITMMTTKWRSSHILREPPYERIMDVMQNELSLLKESMGVVVANLAQSPWQTEVRLLTCACSSSAKCFLRCRSHAQTSSRVRAVMRSRSERFHCMSAMEGGCQVLFL